MLNERCRVFLDLAEILSDSVADAKMSAITWIIIILIIVSILVTVTETGLRFGMLQRSKSNDGASSKSGSHGMANVSWGTGNPLNAPKVVIVPPPATPQRIQQHQHQSTNELRTVDAGFSDLEILARTLGIRGDATLEDIQREIRDLKNGAASSSSSSSSSPPSQQL